MPFLFESRVRYVDTDASGRIHFTAMLRHFEAAEIEFLRSLALERLYPEQERRGIQFPRVHVECNYTAMVRFDDPLRIRVSVDRVGVSSYTLAFDAETNGRAVAHGSVVAVCVDLSTNRSRPLPAVLADALRKYQTEDPREVTK